MSFSEKVGDSQIEGDFSKLEKLVEELDTDYYVDIGILGGETDTETGLTIAGIGAVHEVGTDKIPKRSFIEMPITTKQKNIEESASKEMAKSLPEVEPVFKTIGVACEAAIQEAFDTGGFGKWKDIKEETKDKKGSSAILIDDGTLRKSITSKVGEA